MTNNSRTMTEPATEDRNVPTEEAGDEGGDIAEPGHTPGPWQLRENETEHERFTIQTDDQSFWNIATTHSHTPPNEEAELKNATLMAASPELSAALHNLIREAEDAADALEALGDDGDAGMLRDQIEQAKLTLNKARGAA